MNCRRIVSMMSAYVDGELTGIEMLEIRRHLSECDECAEEYESIRLVKQALARMGTVHPRADFAMSLLSGLDVVRIPRYQRLLNSLGGYAHRKLSPVATALAASGVALVFLSAGLVDKVPNGDVVANASFGSRYEAVSFLKDIPSQSSDISGLKPLRVASDSTLGDSTLQLASLTTR